MWLGREPIASRIEKLETPGIVAAISIMGNLESARIHVHGRFRTHYSQRFASFPSFLDSAALGKPYWQCSALIFVFVVHKHPPKQTHVPLAGCKQQPSAYLCVTQHVLCFFFSGSCVLGSRGDKSAQGVVSVF